MDEAYDTKKTLPLVLKLRKKGEAMIQNFILDHCDNLSDQEYYCYINLELSLSNVSPYYIVQMDQEHKEHQPIFRIATYDPTIPGDFGEWVTMETYFDTESVTTLQQALQDISTTYVVGEKVKHKL